MNEIFHRVSIRRYENKPVEREKIYQILRAGMQAPSAKNQQPWEFYVITNRDKIQALSEISPFSGCAAAAPVLIVPVYRKEGLRAQDFAQVDMAICQENMWLETDSLGLGGVWLGVAPEKRRMDKVRKILDLPDNVEPFSVFVLGYPAESREQQDRFEEERIHFVE